jgi:cysteine desulfurase/selenocysteine lyase
MHEITPNLIAEIATRLLNDVPGANVIPKTEMDAAHAPQAAMGHLPSEASHPMPTLVHAPQLAGQLPSTPTTPLASQPLPNPASFKPDHPSFSAPQPNHSPSVPGLSPMPSVWSPAAAATPAFFTPPSTTGFVPSGMGTSGGSASGQVARSDGYEGLQSFVSRVRQSNSHSTNATCPNDANQDLFRRLFAGQSIPTNGGSRPFDVNAVRRDFPVLHQKVHGRPLVWMDNAATTQKPQAVIDAISRYYANDNSNIHRAAHTLAARSTDAYEQARQKVQLFLGASSAKEIVWVRGTTEGINLIAQTYGRKFFQPGDEIVLSTLEHHANIVPWQLIAKETGAVIRVIPVNDRGEIMLEEYQRILGPRTKFVGLTQASNSLGTILPVAEMTQMAKRYNARVLIDGAQSVAHIPVNMQSLGADFFVFSGHKIFGPTGIGAVYIREELQEIMPPWQGGGNMIKNVTFEETSFSEPPARFEAGTPNIADAIGLGAALDYVQQLGLPAIAQYEHSLLEYGTEQLSRIDRLRLIGTAANKVGVLSFVLPDRKTEEIGRLLDAEGIAVRSGHHCSQPSLRRMGVETTVRPSLSIYNTKEEIDHLADVLRRIPRR